MRSFGLYAYRFSFFVLVLSVAVVVFSYCFRALKMSNHHLRLISGSTIFQQSSSWSFRYPSSDAAVIQFSLFKLCLNFSLHGCKRFMVTRMEFHFGWVYTLSVQSDSLRNRCTPTSKPVSTQQSRAQLCGSSCNTLLWLRRLLSFSHGLFIRCIIVVMCFIFTFSWST